MVELFVVHVLEGLFFVKGPSFVLFLVLSPSHYFLHWWEVVSDRPEWALPLTLLPEVARLVTWLMPFWDSHEDFMPLFSQMLLFLDHWLRWLALQRIFVLIIRLIDWFAFEKSSKDNWFFGTNLFCRIMAFPKVVIPTVDSLIEGWEVRRRKVNVAGCKLTLEGSWRDDWLLLWRKVSLNNKKGSTL